MSAADKVRFSRTPSALTDGEDDESDEEDYSASVSAIMQRRASSRRLSRRSRRRPSSPFSPDADSGLSAGRRTSVFTTSSRDSASLEEGVGGGGGGSSAGGGGGASTQEQIYENLRLHKEVLGSVKQQPWPMRRKLRLVQQAKAYVRRHEGALRERLAQSRTTRDMLSRCHLLLVKRWQYMRRELANLVNVLIPWELRIKEIESHFGSVVASYFTFLRWLFWVNLVIAVLLAAFVAIPEMLTADPDSAGGRKRMPVSEQAKATHLVTLWNFDGVLKYSPFFYGYYTNHDGTRKGYRLPFAYFMTGLAVYVYSFVATLRRMAENSRMSKLSEKDDECVFTWKLFSGWDYMIGNPETAHNRVASIILGFKEALLEEAERRRDARNWKVIGLRVLVNLAVLLLLVSSAYAVVEVVNRSKPKEDGTKASWWRQNEITVVLSLISFVFPILFELLGLLEHYHPRKQLRVQLARIMVLNLLNLYTLIFALFGKISTMTLELELLRGNLSTTAAPVTLAADAGSTAGGDTPAPPHELCAVPVPCGVDAAVATVAAAATTAAAAAIAAALRAAPARDALAALRRRAPSTTTTDWPHDDVEAAIRSAAFDDAVAADYTDYDAWADWESNATIITNTSTLFNSSAYTDFTATDPNVTSTTENDARTYSTTLLQFSNDTSRTTLNTLLSSTSTDITQPFESDLNGDVFQYEYSTESQTLMTDMAESPSSTTLSELCTQIVPCINGSVYVETSTAALPTTTHDASVTNTKTCIDEEMQKKLGTLCWETMFGQELVKLTVMDLIITIISTLIMDFFRAIFVRVMNHCWCWDLEKQFPQYGDFKIAENILHLVNNQGMVWMGMFFCPGLPLLNLVKLAVLMYLRSWAVLTCNVPHEVVFRASRSNNFYLALLLTMLFLCVLPVGYAIVWVNPSWHCGPFSGYQRIYMLFTQSVRGALPAYLHRALDYAASPGIVIPLLVLLVLIIYYLLSLTSALREANNDLKVQLRRERTEERRKVFQLAEGRRCGEADGAAAGTPFARWRKILPVMPVSSKASPAPGATPQPAGDAAAAAALGNGTAKADANRNELLARLMRRALRKSSAESEEDAALVALDAAGSDDALAGPGEAPPAAPSAATTTATAVAEARRRSVLASPSTGSYRERNDSLASGWSDSIPVIRISKTDSSECMLQRAEPQRPVTALPDESSTGDGNDGQAGAGAGAGAGAATAPVHRAARSRGRRDGDVTAESLPLADLHPADADPSQANQAFQHGLTAGPKEDSSSFNNNSQV